MRSNDLCICLDTDKRAIYAGKFAAQYLSNRKKNVLFHHHDMRNGLLQLLTDIRKRANLPLIVLFQHPCPTGDNEVIALACLECVSAMQHDIVQSIHFVYDCHSSTTKTYWKGNSLKNLSISKCNRYSDALEVSDPVVVCDINDMIVEHPVFGKLNRSGWALMKKGYEMAFHIKNKTN